MTADLLRPRHRLTQLPSLGLPPVGDGSGAGREPDPLHPKEEASRRCRVGLPATRSADDRKERLPMSRTSRQVRADITSVMRRQWAEAEKATAEQCPESNAAERPPCDVCQSEPASVREGAVHMCSGCALAAHEERATHPAICFDDEGSLVCICGAKPDDSATPRVLHRARYYRLAMTLLSSPDPIMAIAHQLADTDARVDALTRRLHALEGSFAYHREVS